MSPLRAGTLLAVGLFALGGTPLGVVGLPIDSGGDSEPPDTTDDTGPDPVDTAGPDTIPDAPEPAEAIFNDEELPVFTIKVSVDVANAMQAEYAGGEHDWFEATFVYDEREYGPVGIRLKGENSFEAFRSKPSIKVDFNRFDASMEFLELEGFTLNNMNDDYSMMHERVVYRAYREAGIPAYRSNHALVYVQEVDDDGEVRSDRFYGLYALLENANKDMMRRWFDDAEGSLWEIWDVDFYDNYVPCPNAYGSAGCFQLEYGEENRDHIQAVADAMERTGDAAIDAADPYLDWDAFVSYWAAGAVVGQFDGYPFANPGDDCHFYHDPTSDKLVFFPHGADETFYYPDNDPASVNGILAGRCKASAGCFQDWKDRTWEIHDISTEWDWLAYFDQVRDQIEPWVLEDTNHWYTDEYVVYYQQAMRDFIAYRETKLEGLVAHQN